MVQRAPPYLRRAARMRHGFQAGPNRYDRMRTKGTPLYDLIVKNIRVVRPRHDTVDQLDIGITGESITDVLDAVDRINKVDANGNRLVRIHAVGFPVQFIRAPNLQTTGIRFATLMRELTRRNGGTFVALNDFR